MFLNIRKERCALESRAERFLEMAALIISGGAPKGISPAPRLSPCFALSRSHSGIRLF
jgi:hypothetical protein|tara:strand:- start:66 stop:239 length:174 start_codon:yes stop_codon:yes gene_type:complete